MRLRPFGFILFAPVLAWTATPNLPRYSLTFSANNFGPTSIAIDASGNAYLAGSVVGSPFTATPGAYQSHNMSGTCYGGVGMGPPMAIACRTMFVIKLDPFGKVVFATYLGGSANVDATGVAVDGSGNVYLGADVDGSGNAGEFPITAGAAFPLSSLRGNTAGDYAVLAKLNATGTQLDYATVIPGGFGLLIAVNSAGETLFTGSWGGPAFVPFPATSGAFQTGPRDSAGATIIGKLNAAGSALVFGTYLSGASGTSFGGGIAVASDGSTLTGGTTTAPDFPATAGQFIAGGDNVYLAKLSSDGSQLVYSTLLGPAQGYPMVVGPSGDIYIGCWSANFPVTGAGFGVAPGRGNYLVHVSPDGSSVLSSIYLPFTLNGLDVDAAGNAYVAGSGSVQTTAGAFQPSPLDSSTNQLVVAKISPDGSVSGATYVGAQAGSAAIAAERDGSVVIAGATLGIDFLNIAGDSFLTTNFFPAITIENAASYLANTVAPGELASIRGYGLGPATGVSSSPATNLDGVQVYFDNLAAPILYAQSGQINVQAPWEIAGRAATQVQILYNGATVGSVAAPVTPAFPGVFYVDNSDGLMNSPSNPARAGDFISLYGTGGGILNPPGITGSSWPLSPLSALALPVAVTVGGEAAGILYAGSAPTLESGFFQINARLPGDLGAGAQSLTLSIGGISGASVTVYLD